MNKNYDLEDRTYEFASSLSDLGILRAKSLWKHHQIYLGKNKNASYRIVERRVF